MMKVTAATIAMVTAFAVAVPAFAQMGGGLGDKETPMQKQEKRKEEERKEAEKEYDKTMKRLKSQGPSTDVSSDPWATVRPAAAAPAKTDSKTQPKKR